MPTRLPRSEQICMLLVLTSFLLFPSTTHAQLGTVTQDIATFGAFPNQKPCAVSCFESPEGRICPNDNLGVQIGCASANLCTSRGWQAKNDCYCRSDLQKPAQQWLTSCIQKSCSVGDPLIDASVAGSIYAKYCSERGYTPAAVPANTPARATSAGGSIATSVRLSDGGPTAALGSDSNGSSSSSPSTGPSTLTIVGIIAGSIAGLIVLGAMIWMIFKFCGSRKRAQDQHNVPLMNQQAHYPAHVYQESYYPSPSPRMDQELRPDDSLSVVGLGGPAMPAPTLFSLGAQPQRR